MPEKKTTRFHWKRWLLATGLIAGAAFYWWSASHCYETDLMFHLKLYALPQSMAIIDAPSNTFEVRVRGPRAIINQLRNAELTYPVNLADARQGVQSIKIDSERLPLPPEITVLEVSTGDTTLHLENTTRKRLPIKLHLTGKPAFGYTVADTRAQPSHVLVNGPESKLTLLDAAPTHPIDISGASQPVHQGIALDLPEGVTVLSEERPFSAVVGIAEERTERIIDNIAVNGRKCSLQHVIQPETIRLRVNGSVRSFSNPLYIEKIAVYLDLENLAPGIYVKPANIHLPDGIRLVQAEPQVFTVQIMEPTPRNPSGE